MRNPSYRDNYEMAVLAISITALVTSLLALALVLVK